MGLNNTIFINPNKIDYINSIPIKFKKSTNFFIQKDWDDKKKLVSNHEKEHHTYITCKELFIDKIDYSQTKEYKLFIDYINRGKSYKNCKNLDDIKNYFNKLNLTFEDIKKNNYKNKNQLDNTIIHKEIQFFLNSKGHLIKINAGNHRFAIARILKIKSIPIALNLIHVDNITKYKKNNDLSFFQYINHIIKDIENKYN